MKSKVLGRDRVGGLVLLASMAIMFVGAALANLTLVRGQASFGSNAEQVVAAIAARPSMWRSADILILLAIVLTALGLVPITSSFSGSGSYWARVGLVAFCISAVLGAIRRIISIQLDSWVAVEGIDLSDTTVQAFSRVGEGLGGWFTIMAFASISSYGAALLLSRESRAAGWLLIAGGGAGAFVHLVGAGIPAFIFLGTGTLGAVTLLHGQSILSSEESQSASKGEGPRTA